MNNIEELLNNWSETRTFTELPFKEDMKYCTVTMDDKIGEEKGLDKLINNARRKVKAMTDKIRTRNDMER